MEANINNVFNKIYEEQSDAIFRFCLIRVSNREQALDITQETFLRLWKSLLDNEDILNSRAFLFTVAKRLIIDWYRKKKSISLDKMIDDENSYDISDEKDKNIIGLEAEGRFLQEKIGELSESYRDAVYFRFVEDLSPEEIGKILDISTNAASVRINRGIQELREKTGYNKDK
jgi:RNA polymerase sigma-70 factor (ECF subfamily)